MHIGEGFLLRLSQLQTSRAGLDIDREIAFGSGDIGGETTQHVIPGSRRQGEVFQLSGRAELFAFRASRCPVECQVSGCPVQMEAGEIKMRRQPAGYRNYGSQWRLIQAPMYPMTRSFRRGRFTRIDEERGEVLAFREIQ